MTLDEARTALATRAEVVATADCRRVPGRLTRERRTAERLPEPGEPCGESAGFDFRFLPDDPREVARYLPAGWLDVAP